MDTTRSSGGLRTVYPLALLFLALVVLIPRSPKFNSDYRKGAPWTHETLVAQFDFPVLKTAEQIQAEEAAAQRDAVVPYYRFDDGARDRCLQAVAALDLGSYNAVKPVVSATLGEVYRRGILSERPEMLDGRHVSDEVMFLQREKRAVRRPITDALTLDAARSRVRAALPQTLPDSVAAPLLGCLEPDLVLDAKTTALVRAESQLGVAPTQGIFRAGDTIVREGEMVTAEIAQLLDSYKAEFESSVGYNGARVWNWVGNALIALALVLLLYLSLYFSNPLIFEDAHRYFFLQFIVLLGAVLIFGLDRLHGRLLYLVPFPVLALYLMAFFKNRVVLPVYTLALLPLLIFAHGGSELFVMHLLAGAVAVFAFGRFDRGWKQFIMAFIVMATLLLTFSAFRLISGIRGFSDWILMAYLAGGSLMIVAFYPFIYLFEKIFDLVSNSRLTELCDTNNPLLREMADKAPGSFQHSLQVMNLCEAAARSIGAQVPLVRAGALYHDIGKVRNPLCFVENQPLGENRYHEGRDPEDSARDIIRHVEDGLEIARKEGLPKIVQAFIKTHHGTTPVAWFYDRYLSQGGDPAREEAFRYTGALPRTKEQIILMLCDSIEAASRSLKDYAPQTLSDFVEDIVAGKMRQGQFEQADITIRELNTVKSTLKSYLAQVHHGRVDYPKAPAPLAG